MAGISRGGAFSSFDFARLQNGGIWIDSLGQSLLALSLAAGVMPSYAKSLPEGSSSVVAALKIVVANFIICMLATLSILPFSVTFSRTVGVLGGINAYSQVIFALFSGGAGARVFGASLFAILTVVFCAAAACLAPLFAADGMRILSVCDKIACSVNAVAIAVAETLFVATLRFAEKMPALCGSN